MEDWLHPESKSDLVHSCSFYIVLPVVVCSKEMPQLRCGEVSGEAVTLQDMIQDVIKSISFKYIVKTMASTTVPNPHSSLVCSTMDLNHVVSSLATWRQFKKWCLKNSTCHLKYHKKRKRRTFFLTHGNPCYDPATTTRQYDCTCRIRYFILFYIDVMKLLKFSSKKPSTVKTNHYKQHMLCWDVWLRDGRNSLLPPAPGKPQELR